MAKRGEKNMQTTHTFTNSKVTNARESMPTIVTPTEKYALKIKYSQRMLTKATRMSYSFCCYAINNTVRLLESSDIRKK